MARRAHTILGCLINASTVTQNTIRDNRGVPMENKIKWDHETEVAVVGYGGAGAVTAIAAHDSGANVIIIEKQPADTPDTINHTPSSRMCGGYFLCAANAEKAADYLYWTSWGATPRDCCEAMAKYMVSNEAYMESLGGELVKDFRIENEYHDTAPGSSGIYTALHKGRGPQQFKVFMENIERRKIPVLYGHRAKELIRHPGTGEIIGVCAETDEKKIYVKANKAVVLSTGGFEWDEEMKLNYLRAYPTYFYCNPGNEGDGIKMGQKAGAALWHMNTISGRVVPYIHEIKQAFKAGFTTPFILVDKYGKRFATEPGDPDTGKYRSHGFWLECIRFDTRKVEYPRIPCYQIFDETSRLKGPFAQSGKKGLLPDGTLQYFYKWSDDNSVEIKKGWVQKGDSIEALAKCIAGNDPENEGKMDSAALKKTIMDFKRYCKEGEDGEFHRSRSGMVPLETPPFYALKLYPGGPNTQGGLKKNTKGQVLDSDGKVIPRLYAPGENGSYFGFLYTGGGNICENLVWGRITGENAARETSWK